MGEPAAGVVQVGELEEVVPVARLAAIPALESIAEPVGELRADIVPVGRRAVVVVLVGELIWVVASFGELTVAMVPVGRRAADVVLVDELISVVSSFGELISVVSSFGVLTVDIVPVVEVAAEVVPVGERTAEAATVGELGIMAAAPNVAPEDLDGRAELEGPAEPESESLRVNRRRRGGLVVEDRR